MHAYIECMCVYVHMLGGITSSASQAVGPGNVQWQQPCLSQAYQAYGSRMINFNIIKIKIILCQPC